MITIRNGTVLTADGWSVTNVIVDGARVVALGDAPDGGVEIDATGCLVGPGLVDLHAHLREPGHTWKESIDTASAAAARGGFTAVVAMPNTDPAIDTPELALMVAARGEEVGLVDVRPAGALTVGRSGAVPADIEAMYEAGVRLFTDDGDSVGDAELLGRIMTVVARLPGAVVAQHAEDTTRTEGAHLHQGATARLHGLAGIPAEAEADIVARDLELVTATGARYHCQHVSSHLTVELLESAREAGLPVSAEVTPHHLTFDESHVESLDPNFKMYPPLRSPDDRRALVDALRRGTIDVVATDHAPHAEREKNVPFHQAPRGVIGLETAAAATWEAIADRDRFFEVLSVHPARIAGLDGQGRHLEPGMTANLLVFDPSAEWVAGDFRSRSSNSPYRGRLMRGEVAATIHRGRVVHERVVASP